MCEHPRIAGAQSELHWGIHESNIYLNQRYWGDLAAPARLQRFLDIYGTADYFRLVEGNKEELSRSHPKDFIDCFFELMDRYARNRSAAYWVTKLDYLYYYRPDELAELVSRAKRRYGTFKCIAIVRRDRLATMESYLKMEGKRRQHRTNPIVKHALVVLHSARMIAHGRGIESLVGQQQGLQLSLQELKGERAEVCARICAYLHVEYDERMCRDRYPANSSFSRTQGRRQVLSSWEKAILSFALFPFWETFPWVGIWLLRTREIAKLRTCPLYWRLKKREEAPEKLRKELLEEGEVSLAELLPPEPISPSENICR
jgi:hypothetical protein